MIRKYVLRDKAIKPTKERLYSILKGPIFTEKSTMLAQDNRVILKVDISANKIEIKEAVESVFEMPVKAVNTIISKPRARVFKGKKGSRSNYKKAIITVKEGFDISSILGVQE